LGGFAKRELFLLKSSNGGEKTNVTAQVGDTDFEGSEEVLGDFQRNGFSGNTKSTRN
jgi:hypothetical protein